MHENLAPRVLIAGCGYLGRRLAARYRADAIPVSCVVRSESARAALAEAGLDSLRADLDEEGLPALPSAGARLFYLVPPPAHGERDARIRRLLGCLQGPAAPGRIVYISTTGVYGDCAGGWVDERSPVTA